MGIKKLPDEQMNLISGGKSNGYVFKCTKCKEVWTEWFDTKKDFDKEATYICPNCNEKEGKFKHESCSVPWMAFSPKWRKLKY